MSDNENSGHGAPGAAPVREGRVTSTVDGRASLEFGKAAALAGAASAAARGGS